LTFSLPWKRSTDWA